MRPLLFWLTLIEVLTGMNVARCAAAQVTIAQLRSFLNSNFAKKQSDAAIADRLSVVTLKEQLSSATLGSIFRESKPGPNTIEQLQILAAASVFKSPPVSELLPKPAPDAASQRQMIDAAIGYVEGAVHSLPDFLATKTTISYNNAPVSSRNRRFRPKVQMHFFREQHRQVACSNGREIDDGTDTQSARRANAPSRDYGLTTWGEFGPILDVVLSNSFKGTVVWSRWQRSDDGHELAVFHYEVPKSASDYQIDSCCFEQSHQSPGWQAFRVKPGYHGDLYIDPATGSVDRITLEADLSEDDLMTAAAIAVDYGRVEIGGRIYVCPVRAVALSKTRNLDIEEIDHIGLEYSVNMVRFSDYHKFGSTARILSPDTAIRPQ